MSITIRVVRYSFDGLVPVAACRVALTDPAAAQTRINGPKGTNADGVCSFEDWDDVSRVRVIVDGMTRGEFTVSSGEEIVVNLSG